MQKTWSPARHTRQTVGEQMAQMRTLNHVQVNVLTSHGMTAAIALVMPEVPAKLVLDREQAKRLADSLISQLDRMGVRIG